MTGFDGARQPGLIQARSEGADSVQIKISARHGSLSDTTQAKISAKVEKLTRRFERLTSITVTIDLEHRETPSVDVQVSAEHKHDFVASCQGEELMAGLDQVIHKLEQQLRKYKDKIQDHHRMEGLRQQAVLSEPSSVKNDDDREDLDD
ncbi:MAG: ribosome-associated translation inhibitor RaiA [Pirellulales bacterium]|nr:ribosome-associated translation inhibitor RaiA [Pirellulales bacterium]